MAMQDLRTLVAEGSVTTHVRGESIEVPQCSIGFLLEGFIKAHGLHEELITSPAALLPPPGNQSFRSAHGNQSLQNPNMSGTSAGSFTHQGSRYQVETRASVIFFDMAAFEAENALSRRRSSSVLSYPADHPLRPPSREHGGLMSWPENFYEPMQLKLNHQGTMRSATSLSARAVQLSIFGSTVDLPRRAHSSSINEVKRSQSLSFLKKESLHGRSLVSVRSEGATTAPQHFNVRKLAGSGLPPPSQSSGINEQHNIDESSDESGCEDELIVRIDSPSRLSFCQAP